mmetsp:Transcript_12523/g.36394  ORF Transcript_12523/g.36394 Transcript_12523/m.36394 type:complete len:217 (-) Transcript_12523:677-1327(-)
MARDIVVACEVPSWCCLTWCNCFVAPFNDADVERKTSANSNVRRSYSCLIKRLRRATIKFMTTFAISWSCSTCRVVKDSADLPVASTASLNPTAQSVPMLYPSGVVRGTPRYERKYGAVVVNGLLQKRGSLRASSTMSTFFLAKIVWAQKEIPRGASRISSVSRPESTYWRPRSMSEMVARMSTGANMSLTSLMMLSKPALFSALLPFLSWLSRRK